MYTSLSVSGDDTEKKWKAAVAGEQKTISKWYNACHIVGSPVFLP
jgi:hypothetical protein